MGKTIYISKNQKDSLRESLLLELSNRTIQRAIENSIREYCAVSCMGVPIKAYLDTPLRDCPLYIKQICDPSGDGQIWKSVYNNQTGANKFIDFLRLNFTSQFNITRNSGPVFFAPGLARISMGELGFYSFSPEIMKGGKITTLGNVAIIISNKPDLIENLGLDENFNGMSFIELMKVLLPIIKSFKQEENNELDSMEISCGEHSYNIVEIRDQQYNYAQRTPIPEDREFLNGLYKYTDWCICGPMGDMEYAQYVSNGSKFYICLRDDYKNVQKEEGDNCPLDEYGLSMIAVKVASDGLPDNITTRWNHNNGGENHKNLWLATQLQKILGIRFKDIFKPRTEEELSQMNVGGANDLEEAKTPSIYDQMKGKCIDYGIMQSAAIEEDSEPESDEYKIGADGGNNDYFHSINESIDSKSFDYEKSMLSIANFMRGEGLNVYPFPNIKLNWEDQDGLFIRTGYYEPDTKTVVLFCKDRHPKDILRSFAHEMIHHSQNLDEKDLSFSSNDDVKDNSRLEEIESEAYLKGNIYFRKWTEYEKSAKTNSLNENIDYESVNAQAPDDTINQILDFGININIDEKDWLELIFNGTKTIATCNGHSYKEWKKHVNEMVGLVRTTRHPKKDNQTGVLVGYARLIEVKQYTDYSFSNDYINHCVPQDSEDAKDRCGLVLSDVHKLNEPIKLSHETETVRPLNYPNTSINEDMNPDDVDLSSFNIKQHLNPKFWKHERLDSRIRMKLLDIAGDFIEFLGVDWVKPDDIIMTGSLANFNWDKKYSDIDLHILLDYSKVDKRKDFVANYFYSQKKLWNDEHKGLKIFGFPIEVYVQDTKEKHSSTGVYSLEKDKWIMEPQKEKLSNAKVNKVYIKKKVAEYIDKIDNLVTIYKEANDNNSEIRKVSELAEKLFNEIKKERSKGLETTNNEISNGNIIFKCLRRMNYIEKLIDLKSKSYDKINSLP